MSLELQILLALFFDGIFGDPRWPLHPVRIIGGMAMEVERFCRIVIPSEKLAGVCTVIIVLLVTGGCGWVIIYLAVMFHPLAGDAVSVFFLYTCFAIRDLVDHSARVAAALADSDLSRARKMVGMIVGRDTDTLDREGVIRACVESVAENTVDGVTAPLFWAVVGGPVGALLYKAVNTMDSLFGYRNERYHRFGWAPARVDDLCNWIPARITGLVMVLAAFLLRMRTVACWRIFCRDRLCHASPNSGHVEAAAAGALGLQFGGRSMYFGKPVDKPTIGEPIYQPGQQHIQQMNRLLVGTTVLTSAIFLGIRMGCKLFFQ